MTMIGDSLMDAVNAIRRNGVIAYPTEAIYGLGCNPFSEIAVTKLLNLKQRDVAKGLILIASDWRQLELLIMPIDINRMDIVLSSWPGPATWVFPASSKVPPWLMGAHRSIAIRITNHPTAKKLCELFQSPIVSTSANKTNFSPARDYEQVQTYFDDELDYILQGQVGNLKNPTPIRDAVTGKVIRE